MSVKHSFMHVQTTSQEGYANPNYTNTKFSTLDPKLTQYNCSVS